MKSRLYVARVIPQDGEGECNFSQIDDGLNIGLLPYIKITGNNQIYPVKFINQLTRHLKERGMDELIMDISSRLSKGVEEAERELELIDRLNESLKKQVVRDVSFSYGSVISHAEAYKRLDEICKKHLHPDNSCDLSSFEIITKDEYRKAIEEAKKETIKLSEKAKELGLKIGPENMPCIDYAEIKGNNRKQKDFEKRLRFGYGYFPDLNNPGWIGCNPNGDLKYLIEDDMFLTLDTEHLNFSLIVSKTNNFSLGEKSPFLSASPDENIENIIKNIPQQIRIVHLGAGFDLFYDTTLDNRKVTQIASHFPYLFPGDFDKLSEKGKKNYSSYVNKDSMSLTEEKRKQFMVQCIKALKENIRGNDAIVVMEFEVGEINNNGIWQNLYSGNLWKEFFKISKENLESLL